MAAPHPNAAFTAESLTGSVAITDGGERRLYGVLFDTVKFGVMPIAGIPYR
jgi:hypothetical protein